MGRRKRKSSGFGRLFIVGVIVVGAAAAVGFYASGKIHFGFTPPRQKPIVTVTPKPVAPQREVTVYLPKRDSKGFHLAKSTRTTGAEGDMPDAALQALLDTNKETGMVAGLIPTGTKLLSPVRIDKGVATVNLSSEFTDNFSGGSDQEALTVNSIVHTVVSNSGGKVHGVRILVEGKTVESLGGHLDLTDPVTADSTLLRPGSIR
jgi:germination protein M